MSCDNPFFSIIIPTYGRPRQLAQCLDAITLLEYPGNAFEVIVVDDGSKTSPEDVIKPFQSVIDVKLLVQKHAGPATARNTGAEEARGKFLAFTDDDCQPSRDWLQKLKKRFADNEELIIAGRTINALPDNPYATASQLIIDYLNPYYNENFAKFLTSNNMALGRDQFREIGGFDTTFPLAAAEDREFCDRCIHRGHRTIYAPEIVVHHAHNLTFYKFLRQHFNYGMGAHHFHKIRSGRSREQMKIEPISFYKNLISYPWKTSNERKSLLAFLMFMSQAANASGYFWKKLTG